VKTSTETAAGRDELDRLRKVADEYGIPLLQALPEHAIDPELVRDVPVEWIRKHGVLPVRHDGRVCVLCSDPSCVREHEYLALLLGVDLQPLLAPPGVISEAIDACYYRREDATS